MAIRPEFVQRLLAGEKQVEFRKAAFSRQVTHVLIYETAPTSAVVGAFSVRRLVRGEPPVIWESYRRVGGIDGKRFFAYFADATCAVAIELDRTWRFERPLPLSTFGLRHAPQSFRYVDAGALSQLNLENGGLCAEVDATLA